MQQVTIRPSVHSCDDRGAVYSSKLPQEPGDRGGGGDAPPQDGAAQEEVLEQEAHLMSWSGQVRRLYQITLVHLLPHLPTGGFSPYHVTR